MAELLNHLVFADPGNQAAHAAKELLARPYDQMGYRAESEPWPEEYRSASDELCHGKIIAPPDPADARERLRETPLAMFFDSMVVSLDGPAAQGEHFTVNLVFTDLNQNHLFTGGKCRAAAPLII